MISCSVGLISSAECHFSTVFCAVMQTHSQPPCYCVQQGFDLCI